MAEFSNLVWEQWMVSGNWSIDSIVCRGFLDWLHIAWGYYYLLLLLFIMSSFCMTYFMFEGDTMYGSVGCWKDEM